MSISDTSQQLNGEVKLVFPSETGHFYDPKTGKQVELPRGTWTKTYLAKGYVPGVTTINGQVAKGYGLQKYEGDRFIDCTVEEIENWQNEVCSDEIPHADEIRGLVWESVQVKKDAIFGRGKELHAAIEQYASGDNYISDKWHLHITRLNKDLLALGITLQQGSSEHSFATERYGGKIDWSNDEWILDFKSKDNEKKSETLYFDLCLQMAAYYEGLAIQPPNGHARRRCANVFVGVEDASVKIYNWSSEELEHGWNEFQELLDTWWLRTKRQWSSKKI